jgi:hypothetical protein
LVINERLLVAGAVEVDELSDDLRRPLCGPLLFMVFLVPNK